MPRSLASSSHSAQSTALRAAPGGIACWRSARERPLWMGPAMRSIAATTPCGVSPYREYGTHSPRPMCGPATIPAVTTTASVREPRAIVNRPAIGKRSIDTTRLRCARSELTHEPLDDAIDSKADWIGCGKIMLCPQVGEVLARLRLRQLIRNHRDPNATNRRIRQPTALEGQIDDLADRRQRRAHTAHRCAVRLMADDDRVRLRAVQQAERHPGEARMEQ